MIKHELFLFFLLDNVYGINSVIFLYKKVVALAVSCQNSTAWFSVSSQFASSFGMFSSVSLNESVFEARTLCSSNKKLSSFSRIFMQKDEAKWQIDPKILPGSFGDCFGFFQHWSSLFLFALSSVVWIALRVTLKPSQIIPKKYRLFFGGGGRGGEGAEKGETARVRTPRAQHVLFCARFCLHTWSMFFS